MSLPAPTSLPHHLITWKPCEKAHIRKHGRYEDMVYISLVSVTLKESLKLVIPQMSGLGATSQSQATKLPNQVSPAVRPCGRTC